MVREDYIVMKGSELRRVHVIHQVLARQLTHEQAGEALGLTDRHIRRLRDRLRADGDLGLVHRGRGQPSNRRKPVAFQRQVLQLYARHYADFGPTLAVEHLARHHGSDSARRPCDAGYTLKGSTTSPAAGVRTDAGGCAGPIAANWCSSTARTMIGSRGGARAVS